MPPLAEFLNPDGTLALPVGRALSLDPRGYQLVSGPGEAPRFVPAQPDANPGDENWASGLFPLYGVNDEVWALAVDAAGNLYAGGTFTSAGNHVSVYLARWTAVDGVTSVTTGSYTLYASNLPVTIDILTRGTRDRLAVQRSNRSHPQATPSLATGYYWEIAGTDASGNPATGYVVDLTLPITFTTDTGDQVCRYTGSTWDCAASAHTANSITRTGITQLSEMPIHRGKRDTVWFLVKASPSAAQPAPDP